MKTISLIAFALFMYTNSAYSLDGSSIAGSIKISGILKSSLLKSKIPLGGLTSFYGYEALSYPNSTPVYCFAGLGVSSSNSLLGISFGGDFNKVTTKGKCQAPKDYLGGFLSIGVNYSFKGSNSSKDLSLQSAFNLSFDLDVFNEKVLRAYNGYTRTNRTFKKRLRDVVWHLIQYSGRVSKHKLGENSYFLKLITLPLITIVGPNQSNAISQMRITQQDVKDFQGEKAKGSIRSKILDLFMQIRRDPDFYLNKSIYADEIYVDALSILDAFESALGECHSVNVGVSPTSSFDLSLPILNSKFSYSFSYSYYGQKSILEKNANTTTATLKAFATHNFTKKPDSCIDIEAYAAESFGQFLSMVGYSN
jgi:hypothetical protein